MKKFLFPVAVILMGTGAAFATNHAEVNAAVASTAVRTSFNNPTNN